MLMLMFMFLAWFTDYGLCWVVFMNANCNLYNGSYVLVLMHTSLGRYTDYALWWDVLSKT